MPRGDVADIYVCTYLSADLSDDCFWILIYIGEVLTDFTERRINGFRGMTHRREKHRAHEYKAVKCTHARFEFPAKLQ